MIKIGKKGRIVSGDGHGQYVLIQDDRENTGGYLILTAEDFEFRHGFDGWVEADKLELYVKESHWEIEWLE